MNDVDAESVLVRCRISNREGVTLVPSQLPSTVIPICNVPNVKSDRELASIVCKVRNDDDDDDGGGGGKIKQEGDALLAS